MLSRSLISLALGALCLNAVAAEFYVVVPVKGRTASASEQLPIAVTLNPYTPPQALVGVPYSFDLKTLLSVSGDPGYAGNGITWSVVSSALPEGLYLTADGFIGGTPAAAGTGSVTARATYKTAKGEQTYQVVSLNVSVTLATATLPLAKVGTVFNNYDFRSKVTVTGDPGYSSSNLSFSASGLPAGLSLSSSGVLSGTPTAKNSMGADVNVVATYKSKTGQQTYKLYVYGGTLDVVQVAAGFQHTCALLPSGGVKCWGQNSSGQLGDGGNTISKIPVDVVGLSSGVKQVSVGGYFSCALMHSGRTYCWGVNSAGQLGDGTLNASNTPVAVSGITDAMSLSVGAYHACVVTAAGDVKCWGEGQHGRLGQNSESDSSLPVTVVGLSGVTQVSAGNAHTCAVTSTKDTYCWGLNSSGQLGNNSATTKFLTPQGVVGLGGVTASITTGGDFSCAVTSGGGAKCWGLNSSGQLGDNSLTNRLAPVDVSGLGSGVASIDAGTSNHTCAVTTGGAAKCWGDGAYSKLGTTNTSSKVPVNVQNLSSGVTSLAAGAAHVCAVMTGGAAKCWGLNSVGQLGDTTTTTTSVPVDVVNP